MKIYKIYGLLGLCYVYSMNPVDGELMEEVEIELSTGYQEVNRENGTRGIVCPSNFVSTMFFGPDPTIYEHSENGGGRYQTFQLKA